MEYVRNHFACQASGGIPAFAMTSRTMVFAISIATAIVDPCGTTPGSQTGMVLFFVI